ncbi:MAG: helix-turn-helix transcriptional regulator [Actinobacteria bacterium]|nr:helix-turn-helix transcriptional regulator [Actinomycetota bacterium]
MGSARVGVYDEHEIFRLGVLACLADDPTITVVEDPPPARLDLAVASVRMALRCDFGCGVLICAHDPAIAPVTSRSSVLGVLPRGTLTAPQLAAAVRAAIAGLSVGVSVGVSTAGAASPVLDTRRREVLRLLADGASTAEISRRLHCSERTVKAAITDLKRRLHARNRAHVVAAGIRQGVI